MPVAERDLHRLDDGPRRDAIELIADLGENPALVPAIELSGHPGVWRARFHHDRCRIVYRITKAQRRILVIRIRPRATAYDGMKRKGGSSV